MYEIIYKVTVSRFLHSPKLVFFYFLCRTLLRCFCLCLRESNLLRYLNCSTPFFRRVGETGAWDELPEVHTNNSVATYVVTKLLPFTVYSFRILAVNRLGVSLPSKESYYICTLREGE